MGPIRRIAPGGAALAALLALPFLAQAQKTPSQLERGPEERSPAGARAPELWTEGEPAPPEPAPVPDGDPPPAEPPGDDDAFDMPGGDDSFGEPGDAGIDIRAPGPLTVRGFLRSDWALFAERFGENPWAKGRQSLDLVLTGKHDFLRIHAAGHLEYDFAYLHERDSYDDPTLETYEWDIQPRELLVGLTFGPVDIVFGRQIVAFGEGDILSPLDVVNPRDMREPGLSDLDDIRMSVLATRVDVLFGNHMLEAIVVHENDFGLRSPPFGPWSPLRAVMGTFDTPIPLDVMLAGKTLRYLEMEDRFDIDSHQPMLRWVYKGPGIDLGVCFAYVKDRQGVIELPVDEAKLATMQQLVDAGMADPNDPEIVAAVQAGIPDPLEIELRHPYYYVIGTSGAWAWRSLLLKWEVGAQLDRSYNVLPPGALTPGVAKGSAIDAMVGLSWNGVSDLVLGLEIQKSTFVDEPDGLLFPVDMPQFALRGTYKLLNERLTIALALTLFGPSWGERKDSAGEKVDPADEVGFMLRGEVAYEVVDTLKVGLGYLHYFQSEELGMISGFEDHDLLFWKIRWDFLVL